MISVLGLHQDLNQSLYSPVAWAMDGGAAGWEHRCSRKTYSYHLLKISEADFSRGLSQ